MISIQKVVYSNWWKIPLSFLVLLNKILICPINKNFVGGFGVNLLQPKLPALKKKTIQENKNIGSKAVIMNSRLYFDYITHLK